MHQHTATQGVKAVWARFAPNGINNFRTFNEQYRKSLTPSADIIQGILRKSKF